MSDIARMADLWCDRSWGNGSDPQRAGWYVGRVAPSYQAPHEGRPAPERETRALGVPPDGRGRALAPDADNRWPPQCGRVRHTIRLGRDSPPDHPDDAP